jgi:chromatin remodeling complex protein RSC6
MPPRVKKSETVSETATAATPASTATATPKVAKAPKAPKVKAEAAAVVETASVVEVVATPSKKASKKAAAAAAPVVVAAPVTAAATASESESPAQEAAASTEFTEFMTKLQQLGNLVNALKSEFRTLEKKANKDLKTVAKANAKRKRKNVNRAPSGFVKPTLISAELASFLGKTAGTEMARTEVTREINAYIRDHQLQDKANGRIINADTKLSSLLKIPAGEELTYFNLQRYMSPHFTKNVVVSSA